MPADVFEQSDVFVTQGPTALFLGSTAEQPSSSPGEGVRPQRRQQTAPGNRAQSPEMVIAAEPLSTASARARAAAAAAAIANAAFAAERGRRRGGAAVGSAPVEVRDGAMSFYFEVCIKTTGGGLQPSGTVGVGVVLLSDAPATADSGRTDGRGGDASLVPAVRRPFAPPLRYLHYHSSRGARAESFPRVPQPGSGMGGGGGGGLSRGREIIRAGSFVGGVAYGPSFASGDTVGCGWEAEAGLYFTLNGRNLGVAWAPTALFALLTPDEQVRDLGEMRDLG
jgi:hypothetical protein